MWCKTVSAAGAYMPPCKAAVYLSFSLLFFTSA